MAGIRGAKNPFPDKPKTAKRGVFQQYGSTGPHADLDVKAAAMKSDRKGPTSRGGTPPHNSHYQNLGLKRGTAK